MQENEVIYHNRKEYILDCMKAAVGTLLDENYFSRLFEDVVGTETPEQRTCNRFIRFVKETEDKKYVTESNFTDYITSKKGKLEIEDTEQGVIDNIFSMIEVNRKENNRDLGDPKTLFTKLSAIRKRQKLYSSVHNLFDNDKFSEDAVTWSSDYSEELLTSLEDAISEYSVSDSNENAVMYSEDLSSFYGKRIQERKEGAVYSFHNRLFDELITEGPTPGHGGIIGGSTGMGKSTLCLNLVNDLINSDVPTMYLPIEMGVENTLDRLVSLRTGVPFKEVIRIGKTQEATTDIEELVLHEMRGLETHSNFAIVNKADLDMRKLKSYIQQFQARLPGRKYCIVIIDLLLMIQDFYDVGNNMAQMIEKAINKLDILAKELNFHWIGVVQLGRAAESDKVFSEQAIDKLRPTRTSIKNSNALLERSRWAITIFRKRYFADLYLSSEEAFGIRDIAEIQLMKANDEEIARRFADFDGKTFKMTYSEDYGKSANGF